MSKQSSESLPSFQLRVTPPPESPPPGSHSHLQESSPHNPSRSSPPTEMPSRYSKEDKDMAKWCAIIAGGREPLDWQLLAKSINERSPHKPPITPEECREIISEHMRDHGYLDSGSKHTARPMYTRNAVERLEEVVAETTESVQDLRIEGPKR